MCDLNTVTPVPGTFHFFSLVVALRRSLNLPYFWGGGGGGGVLGGGKMGGVGVEGEE